MNVHRAYSNMSVIVLTQFSKHRHVTIFTIQMYIKIGYTHAVII